MTLDECPTREINKLARDDFFTLIVNLLLYNTAQVCESFRNFDFINFVFVEYVGVEVHIFF